jgi:hypothetical protein
MRPRLALIVLWGALTVGAVVGCGASSSGNGVASKSPDEIITAARNAINRASSVHVAGLIASSAGGSLNLDLHLVAGAGGRGAVSDSGLTFQIVAVGQTLYIRGTRAFWQHFAGAAAARVLTGRWLKAPTTGQFASIAQLVNMHGLVTSLLTSRDALSNGGVTSLRGQKVVAVNDRARDGTLYVAATGPPYPLEITRRGSAGGQLVFDRFNEPVSLTPPAHSIDLSQLG